MKSNTYDQATVAYSSKDYSSALKLYYQCLKEEWSSFGPGDAGLVYHRIGNCLIKMHNFKEASVSYQKALQDLDYTEKTSIYVNLGTTLNGIGKYAEAVGYFNKALSDKSYATPYRAHMGLGSAYTKLGKAVEAGIAYRDAALDESNPNPVKALMSLGSTFSELGRPDDAVEAYLAILDFRVTGTELNKTFDCLGQAYVAAGNYQDGLNTFEEALSHERFELTPEAQAAHQKAKMALGIGTTTMAAAAVTSPQAGFSGQFGAQALQSDYGQGDPFDSQDEFSGFDAQAHSEYDGIDGASNTLEFNEDDGYGGGNVPHAGDTGFFTLSDDDLIETGKRRQRKERKLRNTGLKIILGIIIVLIVALGAAVIAYTQGVGFPSKETVVRDFFSAWATDDLSYQDYWIDIEDADLAEALKDVAKSGNVNIVNDEANMSKARVLIESRLSSGGILHYQVDLRRDVISWKIQDIELIFASSYESTDL